MAYGGTEMLGLTALETANPARVMPLGAMIVAARIVGCYVFPLFIVGLVVHPSAFSSPAYEGLHVVSPFVVAANEAGLTKLALFINAFLILGILSMANASVFASSRATAAICQKGMGPAWLGQLTKNGMPRNALLMVFATTPLALIIAHDRGQMIFDWLLALASQNNVLIVSICGPTCENGILSYQTTNRYPMTVAEHQHCSHPISPSVSKARPYSG